MKHALIIGYGKGVGRALAEKYAAEGYSLTLIARSPELADHNLDTEYSYYSCDASNYSTLQ